MDTLEKVHNFKKECLQELLDQCTPEQRLKFERIFGPATAVEKDLVDQAIIITERTVLQNREDNKGAL